jgi:MFS family permease
LTASSRKTAAIVLAAGFLVMFVGGGARFAIGLTLRPMVEEFGWGRAELGLAVALFQIVSAVGMFIAGRLADRMSMRLLLGAGILVSTFGIGLMSLVEAPWHAVVLYGIAFAVGSGIASTTTVGVMVTGSFPHRPGLANGAVAAGVCAGQLVMIAVLAAVLVEIGWRAVFVWLGVAHLLLLPLLRGIPGRREARARQAAAPRPGMTVREAARTRQFWLLIVIYAICGFDDFFVTTHVVAFAQDKGLNALFAGNLLALMGLTALVGVLAAGAWGDRSGPIWGTAASFAARVAVFALIALDQSTLSVAVFALVFGATFIVTAPLCVVFVRDCFGTAHLGALTGLITMVHHICGGAGAYLGASIFDATGRYDGAFLVMLAVSVIALALTLWLNRLPPYRNRTADI